MCTRPEVAYREPPSPPPSPPCRAGFCPPKPPPPSMPPSPPPCEQFCIDVEPPSHWRLNSCAQWRFELLADVPAGPMEPAHAWPVTDAHTARLAAFARDPNAEVGYCKHRYAAGAGMFPPQSNIEDFLCRASCGGCTPCLPTPPPPIAPPTPPPTPPSPPSPPLRHRRRSRRCRRPQDRQIQTARVSAGAIGDVAHVIYQTSWEQICGISTEWKVRIANPNRNARCCGCPECAVPPPPTSPPVPPAPPPYLLRRPSR